MKDLKYFNLALQMFYGKEMHSTCLLDLKDTHNAFWWVTLNVNMFVYKKAPQGIYKHIQQFQGVNTSDLSAPLLFI